MIRVAVILTLMLAALSARAGEHPPEVRRLLSDAQLRGAAQVEFLAFPLYEAQLWTPERASVDRAEAFALTLIYKRGFRAQSLARASVDEIARMAGRPRADFEELEGLLRDCFADVASGDRITGVSTAPDAAAFFVNGVQSCAISYPDLRDRFFGIWLGMGSRDALATARLRGEG